MNAITPLCCEFLSLVESVLQLVRHEYATQKHLTSLECNIAWNLLLISLYCRDSTLRHKAADILREYPGRDGLWNTQALYILAQKNQLVENVNKMEGSPEEQWHRLLRREYLFEDGGDRVLFRFLDKNEEGEWILTEEVADANEHGQQAYWAKLNHVMFKKLLLPSMIP